MELAKRIEQLRKKNGLSQEQLGLELGLSRQAVSKWESGQSKPDVDTIIKMCELFQVSADWLLRGIEPAAPTEQAHISIQSGILDWSNLDWLDRRFLGGLVSTGLGILGFLILAQFGGGPNHIYQGCGSGLEGFIKFYHLWPLPLILFVLIAYGALWAIPWFIRRKSKK